MSSKEDDIAILTALYDGNHLEPIELERAKKLIFLLNIGMKQRVK